MTQTGSPAVPPRRESEAAPFTRRYGRFGLRGRTALVLTAALSPLLVVAAVSAAASFRTEQEARRERLAAIAAAAADRVDDVVGSARPLVTALAALPQIGGARAAISGSCAAQLERVAASAQWFSGVMRVTPSGRVARASSALSDVRDVHATPWFQRLIAGDDLSVGRLSVTAAFQRVPAGFDAVAIGAAFVSDQSRINDGAFDAAMVAIIDLDTITALIDRAKAPSMHVMLADADGVLFASRGAPPIAAAPADAIAAATASGESQLVAADGDQGRTDVLVARLLGDDLFVVATAPAPSWWSWTRVNLASAVVLPVSMWLLSLLAVLLAIDRFALVWVRYLQRITRLYGGGRFDIAPERAMHAPPEFRELADTLEAMATRLSEQQSVLEDELDQKTTLIKEIHHRVKNNLQIIISLLNVQINNTRKTEVIDELSHARSRINALAAVHKCLYETQDLRAVRVAPFLGDLLDQLATASGGDAQNIAVRMDGVDPRLNPDQAVALALFATEAVTNAFKHAFKERTHGEIRVSLASVDAQTLRLIIEDDGVGLQNPSSAEDGGSGVGSALMTAFARQLNGEAAIDASPLGGVRVTLNFPV